MPSRTENQAKLFDSAVSLPEGLLYRPHFLSEREETDLIQGIRRLPLTHARFREYTAKRRIMGFGWEYDFRRGVLVPGEPLPALFTPVVRKVAKWMDIPRARIVEALVTEYSPEAGIGWHVDREKFEHIIGISLGGWCTMHWRPLPSLFFKNASRRHASVAEKEQKNISLELEPRSIYVMQKEIRWQWQHSIPHTKTHRYSITFRTLPKHY